MNTSEERRAATGQLACLASWAVLARAGPDPPGTDELMVRIVETRDGAERVIEFSIGSITISGETPTGERVHVSSDRITSEALRIELYPKSEQASALQEEPALAAA